MRLHTRTRKIYLDKKLFRTAAAIVSVAYTLQPIILLMIMKKWNLGLDMWHGESLFLPAS